MRTSQIPFVALAVLWTAAVASPSFGANKAAPPGSAPALKPKTAKHPPGAEIFDNKTVLPIRIEISASELAVLRRNDRQDVRATVWEGTNKYPDVGLHIKGAAGSRRPIDDAKPALTLNFQKFTPEQKFHGLRKIHLNNSVQDSSYLTENICSELYRRAGVPTPRVSYATVELNGKKRGLYVLKEGFSKDMLGIYFKHTHGNLYDGGFLREITEPLERDLGGEDDVKDWSDLKALVKAAQTPDPVERFDALSQVLDMNRFVTYCVLQIMTWDWDGYVMNRNNYRVYHDLDTGKMMFFPHGMDQMFWEIPQSIMPPGKFNGLVANRLMETPQGKRLYRERFGQVFTNIFQIELLTNRVAELAALIRPYVGNTNDYNNQANRIRDLILRQHINLTKRLTEPEPKPVVFVSGVAAITNWSIPLLPRDPASAIRDIVDVDGRHTLHILTTNKTTNTTASWRAGLLIGPGLYQFEAMARTAGVVPVPATFTNDLKKGTGAGIRLHASSKPRENKLLGDAPWQKISYVLSNKFDQPIEMELLCELRATAGEAWFDLDSLKLVKVVPASENAKLPREISVAPDLSK